MLPVGIVTTAKRADVLKKTLNSLNEEADIQVFCDLEPGLYWNHKAAWAKLFERSDRALLLQDDVSASRNWYKTANYITKKFSSAPVISLFDPFFSSNKGIEKGYVLKGTPWEQAIIIKKDFYEYKNYLTEKIPSLLSEFEMSKRKGDYHHDLVVNWTLRYTKQSAVCISPPFFQHRIETSTVGNNKTWKGKDRVCEHYLGDSVDAYAYFLEKLK